MRKRHSVREECRRLFICIPGNRGRHNNLIIHSLWIPTNIYYIAIWHFAVAVDAVATIESIVTIIALPMCEGWTKDDLVLLVVGLGGCAFSLGSSVGGLGEVRKSLVTIGDCRFGLIGFVVGTAVRSTPVACVAKSYKWLNRILKDVEDPK